jgi:pyruvate formate lyase activating enzyme
MLLCGLQKLTLLDYPGKMACTVFTGGCNFRCPFCHNASLVLAPGQDGTLDEAEFFAFLQKRRNLLDGVCVTGGEPLLQPDLADFLQKIRALGYLIKLDTNGSSPEKLKALVRAGLLDYVAMDIKAAPEHYGAVIGVPGYDTTAVEESASFLLSGAVPCEFRTTCVKGLHTAHDFERIAEWLAGPTPYFLQGFVDSGDLIGSGVAPFSRTEMEGFLAIVRSRVQNAALRGV